MAALRIDTNPLANLMQRQATQQAEATRERWGTLGAIPGATFGAFRDEQDRQRDLRYRENQDRYYETMRQSQQARTDREARITQAGEVFTGLRKQYGDDVTQLGEVVMSPEGGYDSDVVAEFETWRDASREREAQDRTQAIQATQAQTALYDRAASELSALVDKKGPLVAGEYQQVRDGLFAGAIEMGIPEARALQLLPEEYDKDVIEGTIRLGQDQVERNARILFMHDRMMETHGFTLPKDPIKRLEMQEKFIESGLAQLGVVRDRGDLDRLNELWNRGTDFGQATMPIEIRDVFADLTDTSKFNPNTWSDRVNAERSKHIDAEQISLENRLFNVGIDSEDGRKILATMEAMAEARRAKTGAGSGDGAGSGGRERDISSLTPGQLSTAIGKFNDKQNLSGPAKEQRDIAVGAAADQSVGSFADIQKRLDKLKDADGKAVYTDEDEEDRDAEAQRIRNSGIAVANDKFVRGDLNGLRAEVNLPSMEDEWDLREEARKIMVEIDDPSQWSNPDNPQPVVVLQRDGTFKVGTDVEHPPTDYIDDFLESLSHDELTSFVNTKNQNWDWRNLYRMRGLEDTRLSWVVPEDLSGWQRGHQVTEAHEEVFLGGGEVIPIALRRR